MSQLFIVIIGVIFALCFLISNILPKKSNEDQEKGKGHPSKAFQQASSSTDSGSHGTKRGGFGGSGHGHWGG